MPLALAAAAEFLSTRSEKTRKIVGYLGVLPVPATAFVLFIVVAAVMPQIGAAVEGALSAAPIYVVYAILAPIIGWGIARALRLNAPSGRAIAFSAATRNSLVVLPLAFAVPNAMPLLPAIIVTQTLIELVAELFYVKVMPLVGREKDAPRG